MASIYEVSAWAGTPNTYKKNDTVKHGEYYYYALQDVPVDQTPAVVSAYWGGRITVPISDHAGASNITAPHFIWTPAFNLSVNHRPKIKSVKFGDGYEQRMPDGIHTDLIGISLTFDGRDIRESAAILHFLESRKSTEFFFFTPPSPYSTRRKFICRDFTSSLVSQGVLNITANFEQVP